jgi:hypothetical protein
MKAKPAREDPNPRAHPYCEGVSRLDEPCNEPPAIFCDQCDRWFCAAHAEDDQWHPCLIEPGDEGGEG